MPEKEKSLEEEIIELTDIVEEPIAEEISFPKEEAVKEEDFDSDLDDLFTSAEEKEEVEEGGKENEDELDFDDLFDSEIEVEAKEEPQPESEQDLPEESEEEEIKSFLPEDEPLLEEPEETSTEEISPEEVDAQLDLGSMAEQEEEEKEEELALEIPEEAEGTEEAPLEQEELEPVRESEEVEETLAEDLTSLSLEETEVDTEVREEEEIAPEIEPEEELPLEEGVAPAESTPEVSWNEEEIKALVEQKVQEAVGKEVAELTQKVSELVGLLDAKLEPINSELAEVKNKLDLLEENKSLEEDKKISEFDPEELKAEIAAKVEQTEKKVLSLEETFKNFSAELVEALEKDLNTALKQAESQDTSDFITREDLKNLAKQMRLELEEFVSKQVPLEAARVIREEIANLLAKRKK